MLALLDLWVPILLSAVFVFIASSVIHMALPIHKSDYGKLPNEDKVLEAMRNLGVQPGHYMFPKCESMKEMNTPEVKAKMARGPVGFMTLIPGGQISMNKCLIQWFLFCILISVFAAYLGSIALPRGATYSQVFRFTGTVAILGYAVSGIVDSIWKSQRWGITLKFIFDGVVYGLVTAGTFGWRWPVAI